jgi:hypothetical protein
VFGSVSSDAFAKLATKMTAGKPGYNVVGPEEGQLDVLVVWKQWWYLCIFHIAVGCVLCVGRSPLVGIDNYN